ncbi:MAG: glycoside-pentoside-hexuronide (GPH):cation symporter [Oenococcus sp.]|uniref:glycoside-pentoside-hexuronide (GPH):cation symporter n=1 Tax=Oenococcus sp. TaxID=1979414 RepID=UPI0039EC5C76
MKNFKSSFAYGLGAFGHDAFYGMLNGYLIMFVTSVLFAGGSKTYMAQMIAAVTLIITVVRIVELFMDPLLGGMIDSIHTKHSKYAPWIAGMATISAVLSLLVFSNLFGLSTSNGPLYLTIFAVIFTVFYISYSIKDIAFWGMLPALSTSSDGRGVIATFARIGSTVGGNAVALIYVYVLTLFSGSSTFNQRGWTGFILLIAAVQLIGAYAAALMTKEDKSVVNHPAEHMKISAVFKTLAKNDQLLWMALSYLIFAFGNNIFNNLMIYFFRYILNAQDMWKYVGLIGMATGFVSIVSFPLISKFLKRRQIMITGILAIALSFIVFLFARNSLLALGAYVIFDLANPLVFMIVVLVISDSVEYGQLKTGSRSEAATSSIRPMVDKFGGAIGGVVTGFVATSLGMTGNTTAKDIPASADLTFRVITFVIPAILAIIFLIIYMSKVKLTEAKHDEIVKELAVQAQQRGK